MNIPVRQSSGIIEDTEMTSVVSGQSVSGSFHPNTDGFTRGSEPGPRTRYHTVCRRDLPEGVFLKPKQANVRRHPQAAIGSGLDVVDDSLRNTFASAKVDETFP